MKKSLLLLFVCLAQLSIGQIDSLFDNKVNVESISKVDFRNKEVQIACQGDKILFLSPDNASGVGIIELNGNDTELNLLNGKGDIAISDEGLHFVKVEKSLGLFYYNATKNSLKKIPLWYSLIPPILAITFALIIREVLISLFLGIWSGAFIILGCQFTSLSAYFKSMMNAVDTYVVGSLANKDHIAVIVFSMLVGGMVALISKNGGMLGIVNRLGKFANDRISAMKTTWFLGVMIFFDDYANTLIVGNTMRSVTDKYLISREKLAYLVDSTAAPVAAIAFITTWIGAELGYIGDAMNSLGLENTPSPYAMFMDSLKYSFYPLLTLTFMYMLIAMNRDYGPMHKAEVRALTTGQVSPAATSEEDEPNMEDLSPVKGAKAVWWYAAIPILTVILVTIFGLLSTGFASITEQHSTSGTWAEAWRAIDAANGFARLGMVIGSANSYAALIYASFSGVVVALIITIGSRTIKLMDTMHWFMTGLKTMLPAILVLVLAWSLASVTEVLHTSEFLSNLFSDRINPYFLPALIFVLAAFIAFSTGSSWSTMAILYPIAIPTAYAVCISSGLDAEMANEILLCTIATVLAASVLGDHCSPISDTTILSSLATDCNHIDHVRTQMPYALTVGAVSVTGITVALLLGGGLLICASVFGVSVLGLYLVIKFVGKPTEVVKISH